MKLLKAEAGVNDGKAGLLSAAGLFAKGGIFDKKSESFNIQELDPYLLFDARSSMLGTLENPTLDLDPATPSTLDVITATRASVATRTLSDGTIALAEQDTVRVDYTQGEQLTPTKFQNFGNTDFTSSLWVKNSSTLTFNQETAPDGTQTAAKYVGSGTAQDSYYNDTFTGPFTYSLFVKYINAPFIRLRNGSTSTWFDLTTVSVATKNHDSAAIKDVGDGWFRISVTVNSSSSFIRAYFYPHSTDNTTVEQDGGSFYLWGPQLEEGTTATDFVENTTGSPKFITGATYGPRVPMILVEPSSENLFTHSEGINNFSTLSRTNCTYSLDSNPFGGFNSSCKITSNTFTNGVIKAVLIFNSVSGESNYFTLRVKKKNGWFLKVVAGNGTSSSNVDVGLSGEGFISAGGTTANSYTVEEFNDYYLIGIETLQNATTIAGLISLIFYPDNSFSSYDLNTVEDFFVTGIQFENNATVPTSYIPTSGSTVTRAADDLVISGSDFDFYNQSEGTIYTEFVPRRVDYYQHLYEFSDGSANNRINVHLESANARFYLTSGGTVYANTIAATNVTTGELHRTGFSYKTNDAPASFDGSTEITDTTVTVPSGIDKVFLGALYTQANDFYLNGHIKRLLFWPTHSSRL